MLLPARKLSVAFLFLPVADWWGACRTTPCTRRRFLSGPLYRSKIACRHRPPSENPRECRSQGWSCHTANKKAAAGTSTRCKNFAIEALLRDIKQHKEVRRHSSDFATLFGEVKRYSRLAAGFLAPFRKRCVSRDVKRYSQPCRASFSSAEHAKENQTERAVSFNELREKVTQSRPRKTTPVHSHYSTCAPHSRIHVSVYISGKLSRLAGGDETIPGGFPT